MEVVVSHSLLLFFVLIVHVHVVVVVSKEWTDGRRETFRTPRWRPLVLIKSVPKKWTIKFKNNETRLPIFEKEIPCFRPNSRQLEPARHHEITKSWNKFFFRPSASPPSELFGPLSLRKSKRTAETTFDFFRCLQFPSSRAKLMAIKRGRLVSRSVAIKLNGVEAMRTR